MVDAPPRNLIQLLYLALTPTQTLLDERLAARRHVRQCSQVKDERLDGTDEPHAAPHTRIRHEWVVGADKADRPACLHDEMLDQGVDK